MEEEILVSAAVVYKEPLRKYNGKSRTSWLLVKAANDSEWQLPKGVVRRTESSVRAAIRTLSEVAGIRGRVLEEVGKISARSGKNGRILTKRTIYYLIQQRGKDDIEASSKTVWVDPKNIRGKVKSATEKKMLTEARKVLTEWQKDKRNN